MYVSALKLFPGCIFRGPTASMVGYVYTTYGADVEDIYIRGRFVGVVTGQRRPYRNDGVDRNSGIVSHECMALFHVWPPVRIDFRSSGRGFLVCLLPTYFPQGVTKTSGQTALPDADGYGTRPIGRKIRLRE